MMQSLLGHHICRPKKGSRVEVEGLKNQTQFNGCKGMVLNLGAADCERWLVKLDSGKELQVKAANCKVLDAGYGGLSPLGFGGTYLRPTFTAEGMVCEERPVSEVRGSQPAPPVCGYVQPYNWH